MLMKNVFKIKDKKLELIVLLGVGGMLLVYLLYMSGKDNLREIADDILKEVVEIDFHQRNAIEIKGQTLPTGKKVNEIKISTVNGTEIITLEDSIDEHLADQLAAQYILAQCRPINPDQFNALFKDKMKEKADVSQTGIVYRYEDGRQYSGNDSVSCKGAICSEVHALDIKNTACIQAWVECPPAVIWRHADGKVWVIAALYAVFASLALWRIRRKKEVPLVEEPVLPAPPVEEVFDPVREAIHLDAVSQCMQVGGKSVKLRNTGFQIMDMLMESPEHRVSRGEISRALWPDEIGRTNSAVLNNRIDGHIHYLRKVLKEFPQCTLVGDEPDFFRLAVGQEILKNLCLCAVPMK